MAGELECSVDLKSGLRHQYLLLTGVHSPSSASLCTVVRESDCVAEAGVVDVTSSSLRFPREGAEGKWTGCSFLSTAREWPRVPKLEAAAVDLRQDFAAEAPLGGSPVGGNQLGGETYTLGRGRLLLDGGRLRCCLQDEGTHYDGPQPRAAGGQLRHGGGLTLVSLDLGLGGVAVAKVGRGPVHGTGRGGIVRFLGWREASRGESGLGRHGGGASRRGREVFGSPLLTPWWE